MQALPIIRSRDLDWQELTAQELRIRELRKARAKHTAVLSLRRRTWVRPTCWARFRAWLLQPVI